MEQADLLAFAIETLERLNIPYMLVGSYASGVYGEPRLTVDIDIVIDPTLAQVVQLCDAFPTQDFYVSKEAASASPTDQWPVQCDSLSIWQQNRFHDRAA